MSDEPRGTGRTTRQMQAAPPGAYYVSEQPTAARDLARHLNRPDLRIVRPAEIIDRVRGMRLPIIVDHAAALSPEQWAAVEAADWSRP